MHITRRRAAPMLMRTRPFTRPLTRRLLPVLQLLLAGAIAAALAVPRVALAQAPVPQVERPITFDAARRITVLTPMVAARWRLMPPEWPLGGDWKEARLFAVDTAVVTATVAVLVVQRVDGAVVRYAYSADALARLRRVIDAAVIAQGANIDSTRGTSGLELSEPAGNAFVRSQIGLGLLAYGPAAAAIFSESGAAAATGGYFLAAGSAFFIAGRTVRHRTVSRAQNTLASHGGTRGAIAGAMLAAIANADNGPGYGAPILLGALGGTIAGFRGARGLSDGEAASSGLGADLGALTTLGVAGMFGVFDEDTSRTGDDLTARAKAAFGGAIAAGLAGYYVGPRYARRAAYNVTAGDISLSYTSAALGALASTAVLDDSSSSRTAAAVVTAGMLAGAALADRFLVRRFDRTTADGSQAQLGALAGMLMGGGLVAIAKTEYQPSVALIAAGGVAGMLIADRLGAPAPDAGPRRGVLPSGGASGGTNGSYAASRVSLSIVPAATTIALGMRGARTGRPTLITLGDRPAITNVPVMRIAF